MDTGPIHERKPIRTDNSKPQAILWLQLMLGVDAVFTIASYFLLRSILSLPTVNIPAIYVNLTLIIPVIEVIIIYGLQKRAKWAFVSTIVIFSLTLLGNLLMLRVWGIILDVFVLIYALKAKSYFQETR